MRLEASGLACVRGGREVFTGLGFSVGTGEALLVTGRNGAGKSSAVRCLLGQQRPSGGRALLFGLDAWRERAAAMARIGVVPEEPDVPPEMTAPPVLVVHCETKLPAVLVVMAVSAPLKPVRDPLNTYAGQSSGDEARLLGAIATEPIPNRSASNPGMTNATVGRTNGRRESRSPRLFVATTPIAPNAERPSIGSPFRFAPPLRKSLPRATIRKSEEACKTLDETQYAERARCERECPLLQWVGE